MGWEVVGCARAQVGESAAWDVESDGLWWVDVWGKAVHHRFATGRERVWPTPEMASAIVLATEGVLVALEGGLWHLAPDTGALSPVCAPSDHPDTHRFNDTAVDAHGRLLIGTMRKSQLGAAPTGTLYAFDGTRWRTLLGDFWTVNGLAFSPDGRTLYVSDSHPSVRTIWACGYDPEEGSVHDRRVFASLAGLEGRPDGAAVDVEGGYWIAGVGGGCLYRFDPAGALVAEMPLPVENPTKIAFGGPDLRTVFVTSMSVRLTRPDPDGLAGAVLASPSPVAGLPVPRFAGGAPQPT